MINILITGGAGFIGKNLIKYLYKNIADSLGYIVVIDDFTSSNKEDFEKFVKENGYDFRQYIEYNKYGMRRAMTVPMNKELILIEEDICNINTFSFLNCYQMKSKEGEEIIYDNYKINQIYHLASIASPPLYKNLPFETLDVGYIGTKNILEFSYIYKCKVLYTSTSEVYGDASISPQHEDYYGNVNPFGERSCYDISKRIGETLCYNYIKQHHIDIKIARLFNTYGPYMRLDDGRIITETIKHLLNDTTLTVYGDGTQTRSCVYVDDTVTMLYKLMNSDYNSPLNIGNDVEMSVNDIVNVIYNVYKDKFKGLNKLKIKNLPLTQNDPLKRKPSLLKNKSILGEMKYTDFTMGIEKMFSFYFGK